MRPRIYAASGAEHFCDTRVERIAEFNSGQGKGGLIALRNLPGGELLVNVYRTDPGVIVTSESTRVLLAALEATITPLIRLGDFIGNEDKGGASGLGPFDRCAILSQVRAAIAKATGGLSDADRAK